MTAGRVGGTVLARRLTGAPEAWVRVDKFTADARDALRVMRDTVESLSAKHMGDVIAFRLASALPERGRGVFYWYVSPTHGVVEIPPAAPDWGEADVSKTARGRDWLSCWTESTHAGWMLEALSRVSKPDAERVATLFIERGIATGERYAIALRDRAGDDSQRKMGATLLTQFREMRDRMATNPEAVVNSIPLRDLAAAWGCHRAAFFDVDRPLRLRPAAVTAARMESGETPDESWRLMALARRGALYDVERDVLDAVRRIASDEIRADVPLGVLLPLLAERAVRANGAMTQPPSTV